MPTLKLNDLAVKNAKALGGKQTEFTIERVRGLVLRVEASGRAAFYLRYRGKVAGKSAVKRFKIGDREHIALKDAAARATELMSALAKGDDPRSAQIERAESLTVKALWDRRKEEQADELSATTIKNYGVVLNAHVFEALGDKPAGQVSLSEVAIILNNLSRTSKGTTRLLRAALRSTFSWAHERHLLAVNPLADLKLKIKLKARERIVTAEEIGKLWAGIDGVDITDSARSMIKLLLLTAQRNSTVSGARRDELKTLAAANPEWRIAKGRMKKKSSGQTLPLTPTTAKLFREAVARVAEGEFVFPQPLLAKYGKQAPINPSVVATAMRKVCSALGIENLHVHDFRKAFETWEAETTRDFEVRKAVLHHKSPDPLAGNYNFAQYSGPMRDMLLRWEAYVGACAVALSGRSGSTEKVVAFPGALVG